MKGLFTVYIVLFITLTVLAIREGLRLGAPAWKLLASTIGAATGTAGMILYTGEQVPPRVSAAWAWVFPLLVLQVLVDAYWDYRYGIERLTAREDLEPKEGRALVGRSLFGGLVLLAPYFYANFRLAYG